jgi:hypothetical protein
MTITYSNAIKGMDINIKKSRLPDGSEFPNPGGLSGASIPNDNPLSGGATMGGEPDGRNLPEYVDFEWRESPRSPPDPTPIDPFSQAHKDWQNKMMADFYSQPIKKQRVLIRNRVPSEVVTAVIEEIAIPRKINSPQQALKFSSSGPTMASSFAGRSGTGPHQRFNTTLIRAATKLSLLARR